MNLPLVPMPTFLQIEPVGQCNLRCQMCPIQFRRDGPPHGPPAFMAWDLFTKLIDEFHPLQRLQLQGLGEPMMHPRFFDMVTFAVRRGIDVSTNTNLTLLNEARAERCVTSGLGEIHASLDGATAQTYESIRVRARFDKVVANFGGLMAARRRLQSSTPAVRLVFVVMRQNLRELPDLVRLASDLGIRAIFVQHLCHDFGEASLPAEYRPMREFVEEQTLMHVDGDLVAEWFDRTRRGADECGIDVRLPTLGDRPAGESKCDWPWSGGYVSYDGRAMPCCMVATPDRACLGDLSQENAAQVWNGPLYRTFREALRSDNPTSICQSCSIYNGTF